jgi:flavin-dependent dehydrogenase
MRVNSLLPVEIVGGGLAGLSAGLALRRAGVPVTLYEAGAYPRHRVCGEFISGLDCGTAGRLGIGEFLADAHPHRSVTYHLRDRPIRPFSLPAPAWGISRHTLDARLARAFVAAGGNLRTNTRMPEGETPPGRVFAAGRRRKGPFWVGLKVHVRNLSLVNGFEVHLGDRAYMGLSKVETGAVNVCGIFAQRALSARGIDMIPSYLDASGLGALAERLRAADMDPATFCVTAASLGDRRVAAPDRIWIGDACASIAPFTGNGLAMALQGADLAVEPLRSYSSREASWAESIRTIAAAQSRRFRRRLMLASLLHPFFLESRRQRLLATLASLRLVPFRAFYAALR